ncbi:Pleiotropic drug resistance protein 3 [Capsicum annuum]|nr:Pleiotropic drug resistance protein 3 [Capsicum annuum]
MEAPNLNNFRGSMRESLRDNASNSIFSRSTRDEDDEEALRWAALEKLPTFNRMRKGLLFGPEGEAIEVDTNNIGHQERKNLLDRLVKVADEDNEKFLLKLKDRIETKRQITILKDLSGMIKPSRMTLLLGPPSSGKTTLLLALAGKLDPTLKVTGNVTYNGHELYEFVPQKTAVYISQHDLHIGEMTVRETLEFSARCQGVGPRYEMLAELSRREKASKIKPDPDIDIYMKASVTKGQEANVVTDYVLKILGLDVCADTMVGDEMLRGISGGQKKRVTTGEMLVGPAKALFMDEISTGLDSSTTFSIVNSLRQSVQLLKGTAVISLLQPAPETYNLFDDIILLSDGYIVYQGAREAVLEFFESMGFKCPERKGLADFLQEVTSKKDQQQYWAKKNEPYRFVASKEFAEAYQSFHVGKKLADELATPYDKSKSHPAALCTKKYGIGTKQMLKVCAEREFLLMKRNAFVYIFKMFQLAVMALITMTVFFRTKMPRDNMDDGGMYAGALFFVVVMIMFNGMAEINLTILKLPVFFKQRDLLFFPSWAYALPTWILRIPITFIECAMWTFITYYVMGFDPEVSRLFKQFLLLVLVHQMASGLYRFIGAAGRTMGVASTFGAFALVLQFALSGFVLSREDVKKWWIWGYWISPLMYSVNSILVNEFDGKKWKRKATNGNETLGHAVVRARGFFPDAYWYWIGVGALIAFVIIFNFCYSIGLAYLKPFGKPQAMISEDDENADNVRLIEGSETEGRDKKRGMVLPFKPHSITFDNVVYSVDMPQEIKDQGSTEDRLVLLKGVSGAFRPGVLTALMGVSGAGKTTLMDVLAGRKTGGYIDGDIEISGYPKKQETFARISGYCEQNDIHSPYVTVYESLVYSAWLRLPHDVDKNKRKMFVEEVMELVELTPLRSALVGLPGVNGLSTEQRKRLTIAVELVANPSIIFMDEPTSGLDARAAAIVMRAVRNTVDTGRTVVCTIHQPSIDIFEAFDELFLMKRGGQEIYVGPLGRCSCQLIKYFESMPGVSKIKDAYNPATWMLEVTATSQEMALGVDFADLYKNSDLYRRNKALIAELSTPRPGTKDLHFETQFSQPFWTQCMACLWKQYLSYWRNPSYTSVRFLFTVFLALIFGTMFWDLGTKVSRSQDLLNAMGSMYAATLFLGVQNSSSVQPVVAVERTVFYRERAAGMYSALPYAFGQVVIEIPYVFVQAAFYGIIVYAMIGFEWTAAKFFWYFFIMYFTLLYFTFYGMMTVAVTPNQNVASIVAAFFYAVWNLFSGFIVPRPRIPIWWRWYYWLCPVAWTLYGLVASQFGDLQNKLSDDENVEQFLARYFGFEHDFLGVVAAIIVACPFIFAFIIVEVGNISYDVGLLSALVERWRPETHTFHLRIGEATITLQDIEIMFEMVVDGSSRLLEDCFSGIRRILVSKLAAYVKELDDITDDTPEIEVQQRVRLYLLWYGHGSVLFHFSQYRTLWEQTIIRPRLHLHVSGDEAMGHETIYRMAQLVLRDSRATSEMYGFASEVARISSESMNSAYLGTRLSFAPNYAPPTQSVESPPVQVCRQERQSASRDSTRQGRRSGRRADSMADRSEEPHDNFGLSLASTTEAYYPTFEFGEPSTAVTNFSREETIGFVTPPIVQYDFAQLSEFHHALQSEMREFLMKNSPFTEALSFFDVSQ